MSTSGHSHASPAPDVDEGGTPAPLSIIRAFVNTFDVEDDVDDLTGPDALAQWLVAHGLAPADAAMALGESDVERARRVREALREALVANHDAMPVPHDARDVLEHEAERCPLRVRLDDEAVLVPAAGLAPLDAAVAQLLAIMHDATMDGTWQRLRICREDTCQWAFYDSSRNRSGKWCGTGCANRANVRAYRRRQRQSGS